MPWRQGMKACSWCTTESTLAALCILNSIVSILCGQCPSGWQEGLIEDHCFLAMSNASSTWNESEIICQSLGGHLAALSSIAELQEVQNLCIVNSSSGGGGGGGGGGGCWIGGSQQKSIGLPPNWTDCHVQWNISIFTPAPFPTPTCSNPSCPDFSPDGWCSVVTNSTLAWEHCGSRRPFVCGLVQGGSCGVRQSHREYIIIIIAVSSVILTTTLGVTIWLLAFRTTKRRRRRRRRRRLEESLAGTQAPIPWRVFRFGELEAFTEGFSPDNRLLGIGGGGGGGGGSGGGGEDGNTFKGTLADGSAVVVKKVRRPGFQGERDFIAEMYKVGRLKHPNLVAMRGCCFERDEGYSVYEFISNGTLESWLHRPPPGRSLDWDTRMRIATGVANVLSFLHDKMKPNLVHRNVRSSTILLDDNFEPHVIGVGLVNMVTARDTINEPTVSVGTHGYLAPEFVYRNELTTKSDVYSFGVLLLELITGRWPTSAGAVGDEEQPFSEAPTIFEWATPLVQAEAWTDLLDVSIGTVPNFSQVKKVADLVYTCTQHVPSMRPRMAYVLFQLEELHTAELTVLPMETAHTPRRSPAATTPARAGAVAWDRASPSGTANLDPELQPVDDSDHDDMSDVEIQEIPL